MTQANSTSQRTEITEFLPFESCVRFQFNFPRLCLLRSVVLFSFSSNTHSHRIRVSVLMFMCALVRLPIHSIHSHTLTHTQCSPSNWELFIFIMKQIIIRRAPHRIVKLLRWPWLWLWVCSVHTLSKRTKKKRRNKNKNYARRMLIAHSRNPYSEIVSLKFYVHVNRRENSIFSPNRLHCTNVR